MSIRNLILTKENLFAPLSYVQSSDLEKAGVINGCGPKGFWNSIIPNTIYGLYIGEACNIHDWQYHFGETEEDRKFADETLLKNIMLLIDAENNTFGIVKWLRKARAKKIFLAVEMLGEKYFKSTNVT